MNVTPSSCSQCCLETYNKILNCKATLLTLRFMNKNAEFSKPIELVSKVRRPAWNGYKIKTKFLAER